MRERKLYSKERGQYGKGRKEKPRSIQVCKTVKDEMDLIKKAYSICLSKQVDEYGNMVPIRVSFDQVLWRWVEHVGRIDPDVKKKYDELKNAATTERKEEWNIKYYFSKDGKKLEAWIGNIAPFYAKDTHGNIGMKDMVSQGWVLQDESGNVINEARANEIQRMYKNYINEIKASNK